MKKQTLWQVKLALKQGDKTMTVGSVVAVETVSDQLNCAVDIAREAFPLVVKADPNQGPTFDAEKYDAAAVEVVSVAKAGEVWSR